MVGSIVLAISYVVANVVILTVLGKRKRGRDQTQGWSVRSNLLLLSGSFLFPMFLGLFLGKLSSKVISTVIWQFFLSGFGEEILYRGYCQSRIKEEFGCPFKFLGVEFGVGLVISSLLFASLHALNPFNPLIGKSELAWWWGFWNFFAGLFFGFVREKDGKHNIYWNRTWTA